MQRINYPAGKIFMKTLTVFTALALATLAALTLGQPFAQSAEETMHHGKKMGHGMKAMGDNSASSKAFRDASAKMHKNMDVTYTGNADVDFVKGMIAHHQGAIDAAKIELQYGKNP